MPEYYRHIKTGNKYELLFEAINKSDDDLIVFVYEDMQGNKYTRNDVEFLEKFEKCNPPVDWQKLYHNASYYSLSLSRAIIEKHMKKGLTYEEMSNRFEKIRLYTLKRLKRYS